MLDYKQEAQDGPNSLTWENQQIWPSDLLFDLTTPTFDRIHQLYMINFLSKFDEDWVKTVASRVVTRFFLDLT